MHRRSYTKVPVVKKLTARTKSSEGILTAKTSARTNQRQASKELTHRPVKVNPAIKIPSLPVKKPTRNRNLEELFNLFSNKSPRFDFIDQEMDNTMLEIDEIIKFGIKLSSKHEMNYIAEEIEENKLDELDNSKVYHFTKNTIPKLRKAKKIKLKTISSSKQLRNLDNKNNSMSIHDGYHEELNRIENISIPPLISNSYLSNRNYYVSYERVRSM